MNVTTGILASLLLFVGLALNSLVANAVDSTEAHARSMAARRCIAINTPSDVAPAGETTIVTLEQGYWCILDHYVGQKQLDDRVLLRGAAKLLRSNLGGAKLLDLAKLTGDRTKDWMVFRRTLTHFITSVPGLSLVSTVIMQAALEGMALSLNDDHTGYLPPQYIKPALAQLAEEPAPSFGLVTTPITTTVKSPLFMTSIQARTPAATAGLRPGDVITAINGTTLTTSRSPSLALIALLFPQAGATLALTVTRPQSGSIFTATLTARNIVSPTTSSRLIANSIAYVKLFVFSKHAAAHLSDEVRALSRTGALTGLVLDLRGNPGGDEGQAIRIASAFLGKVTFGYTVNSDGRRVAQRSSDDVQAIHLPLVVLIDGGSASSSELIAGAVKDYHRGLLIGEKSMGALAEAEFYGLGDGGGMEITIARVFGPHNERVDGIGIAPDLHVVTRAVDRSAGHDPAVEAAVHAIKAHLVAAS